MRKTPLVALLLLAGCHQPSFDERYDKAEKAIRDKAASIDRELAQREKERREAEALVSVSPAPASSPAAPARRIPPQ